MTAPASNGKKFYLLSVVIFNVLMIAIFLTFAAYLLFCPTALEDRPSFVKYTLGIALLLYSIFRGFRVILKFKTLMNAE